MSIADAIDVLKFSKQKAAFLLKKVILSAVANAEQNHSVDIDELKFHSIFVNEGTRMKRFHARARGRGNTIIKRTSHITVVLTNNEQE
jgi:large subunit ribosomal protein L22